MLESKSLEKEATVRKESPILTKLQEMEGKSMEKTVWRLRRENAPRESDLKRKYQPGEIRADMYNIDEGLQENTAAYRPGDRQKPLI